MNYNPKEIIILGQINQNSPLFTYLELDQKKVHYMPNINKTFSKVSYQNEFFGKIYKNNGLLSPIEFLDMEKLTYARLSFVTLLRFHFRT